MKDKKGIWVFLCSLFISIMTYGAFLGGRLANPDAVWNSTVFKEGWKWEASLGRPFIRFFQLLFGSGIHPFFATFVSFVCLALISYLAFRIFHVKKTGNGILLGAVLIVNPVICCTLTYYYCSAYYMAAYCFSMGAVLLSSLASKEKKISKKILWMILGGLLLCISLGTYQAYIGVYITASLLSLCMTLLDEEKDAKIFGKEILGKAIVFVTGVVSYLVVNKILMKLWWIRPDDSRGFDHMGAISNPFAKITGCYRLFAEYFLKDTMMNNSYGTYLSRRVFHILFFVVLCVLILTVLIRSRKKIGYKLGFSGLIVLLPVAVFSITIATDKVSIYKSTGVLMIPTVAFVYGLAVLLMDRISAFEGKKVRTALTATAALALCLILIMQIHFVSDAVSYGKHNMDKTTYLAYEMAGEIAEAGGKAQDTVCVIGSPKDGNFPELYPKLSESVKWTTFSYGNIWEQDPYAVQYGWVTFIEQYLGVSYQPASLEDYYGVLSGEEFGGMPLFPEKGSVAKIGNVYVVKFAEIAE